jgi:hypothetical protein
MTLLTDFRQVIFDGVTEIGSNFKEPDDDWMPVMFLMTKKREVVVVGTPFTNAKDKEIFAKVLPKIILEKKAVMAAFLASTWLRTVKKTDPLFNTTCEMLGTFGVSTDPQRQEILMLQISDRKSNEDWFAKITRFSDKPPHLEEWERQEWTSASGRFGGFIQKALAKANT